MNNGLLTYLYFCSNGSLSHLRLLRYSIAHYFSFSEKYLLITDIPKEHFACFSESDNFQIVHPDEIESKETREVLKSLVLSWQKGELKANHPPTEYHCFKRWFILRDYLENNKLANIQICSHDWDDLLLMPLNEVVREAFKNGSDLSQGDKLIISSAYEVRMILHQAFFYLATAR